MEYSKTAKELLNEHHHNGIPYHEEYTEEYGEEVKMEYGIPDKIIMSNDSSHTNGVFHLDELKRSIVVSTNYSVNSKLLGYYIQKWINNSTTDNIDIEVKRKTTLDIGPSKKATVIDIGTVAFSFNGFIGVYTANLNECTQIVTSNNLNTLKKIYNELVKYIDSNFLRNHIVRVSVNDGNELSYIPEKHNKINYNNVILDNKIKDDIYDNTIFYLKNFEKPNGIILHGPPGNGKTLICKALSDEALKNDIAIFYSNNYFNFPCFIETKELFLNKTLLVLEDIDSFGQDRRETQNSRISSFLTDLNGISDENENIAFLATTNFLDHLDDAIKNRPMRFNRKYFIDLPDENMIEKLVKIYFSDTKASSQYKVCCGRKFTGAHIAELRRTFDMIKKKDVSNKSSDIDIFKKSLAIIDDNFKLESGDTGFQ